MQEKNQSILKKKLNNNFTMINNEILRCKELSLKSKGLYAFMIGLPNNWAFSVIGISKVLKEGKECVRTAIFELEEIGLLRRTQERNEKGLLINNFLIIIF